MHIGIIGNGVVGGALRKWVQKNTLHDILIYDPPKWRKDRLVKARVVFISVPVPTRDDGTQDISILRESLKLCNPTQIIFIRSTVLPGTCDRLQAEDSLNIYAMPEFLTERNADSDFCRLPIVMGGLSVPVPEFVSRIFPGKHIYTMTNTEAEMAKYTHNVFGAMKVIYFNHIYGICQKLGIDFDAVKMGIGLTHHISRTYTTVPGAFDKKFGFGGHCFPKDLKAFTKFHKDKYTTDKETLFEVIDRDNRIFRSSE